jgi:hypothetical protein
MTMPILEIIKQAAILSGLKEPTTAVANTDLDVQKLLLYATETGRQLRDEFLFPALKKTFLLTTTTATQYQFPGDFWKMISSTQWDQSNQWQMYGPLTDQDWNYHLYGTVSSTTRRRFRVFGSNTVSGQFFIQPAPSSGEIISFDYLRAQWFLPKVWTAGETSIVADATYRSYGGNIYLAKSTGTAGATPPTHTTGTVTDGTINWLYVVDQMYLASSDRFKADTDFCLFDDDLMIKGVIWRAQNKRGTEYEEAKQAFSAKAKRRLTNLTGAPIISLAGDNRSQFINSDNIPEGNYG